MHVHCLYMSEFRKRGVGTEGKEKCDVFVVCAQGRGIVSKGKNVLISVGQRIS